MMLARIGRPLAVGGLALAVIASLLWSAMQVYTHAQGDGIATITPPITAPIDVAQVEQVDVTPIIALAPFGTAPPPEPEASTEEEPEPDLILQGIVFEGGGAQSLALIATEDAISAYRVGDAINEDATLIDIARDSVTIGVGETQRTLTFPGGGDTIRTSEPAAPARPASPVTTDREKATALGLDRLRDAIGAGSVDDP